MGQLLGQLVPAVPGRDAGAAPRCDQTYAARGLAIVGISVQEASAADVAAYAQKYSLGYRIAADLGGDIFHKYKVYALPTQFFIDTSGRIAAVVQGPMDQATRAPRSRHCSRSPCSVATAVPSGSTGSHTPEPDGQPQSASYW